MDKRIENEVNNLKRITMTFTDIDYCEKYLNKALHEKDEIILRALSEAIIISYVRPFSGNYGVNLKTNKCTKKFILEEKKLHNRILELRNKIIAHSDKESYGVNLYISNILDSNFLFPMQRRIIELLTKRDLEVLICCCRKLKDFLFEEQIRIKNFLPEGSY